MLNLREALTSRKDLVQKIDEDRHISKDLLMALRSQGIFGLRGKVEHGGEGTSVTESLRCLEEVATANLNVSNVIVNSTWYAASFLRKYGSKELQDQYLPDLYAGTSTAALCVADEFAGCDANATTTTLLQDPMSNEILLNGTKLWVTNGDNADLLIVLGKTFGKYSDGNLASRLMAVLVDVKQTNGITIGCSSYPARGLQACSHSTVTFKHVCTCLLQSRTLINLLCKL